MWQEAYAITNVISPPEKFEVTLTEGWNLISIPLNLTNKTLPFSLSSIKDSYESVFAYTNGKWKPYIPNSSSNTLTSINETLGLWVKMNKTDTLTVYGTKANQINFTLNNGWNLVGNPVETRNITNLLQSISGCYKSIFAYWLDRWYSFNPLRPYELNTLKNMTLGKGYWINVNCSSVDWTY